MNDWMLLYSGCFYSSLIDQGIYIGFLAEWTIELVSILRNTIILTTTGSLYIGLCLYACGMVAALKVKMATFDESTDIRSKLPHIREIYTKAVGWHIDLIRYIFQYLVENGLVRSRMDESGRVERTVENGRVRSSREIGRERSSRVESGLERSTPIEENRSSPSNPSSFKLNKPNVFSPSAAMQPP